MNTPDTNTPDTFGAFMVRRDEADGLRRQIESVPFHDAPAGDVVIRVAWSSLNYKDYLAAEGHPGVARQLPHVPGIDAAGTVVSSDAALYKPGEQVFVTGFELGAGRWGGWAEYVRVPSEWILPLPDALSAREVMILGTAGLTAAQSVVRIQQSEIQPEDGPVVVTGATGGVGCLAVSLLSRLGYEVTASTGKPNAADWLRELGAATVIRREEVINSPEKPLSSAQWAAAVDTVGGATLASIVRGCRVNGCVTACGLVGGTDLALTVHPFILRGVTLAGVTSQHCPMELRRVIWSRFADAWRLTTLDGLCHETDLTGLEPWLNRMSQGQVQGRVVVRVGTDVRVSRDTADAPVE